MKEKEILDLVNLTFDLNLAETDTYHTIDGIDHNKEVICEVKSRSCRKDRYPTTMIGANKVQFANRVYPTFTFLMVFEFTDGVYFYVYDKKHPHEVAIGGRSDRGRVERRQYCYIPKDFLQKLSLNKEYDLACEKKQAQHLPC